MSQATVDSSSSSRIDKTFGKSYNLRYVMNLVGLIHQPMRNINRYSADHPDGDNFGKDQKISISGYKNLFDLVEDAFGQYRDLNYPLSSTTLLDEYTEKIMADFPKTEFKSEIADIEKSNWSKESYEIGVGFYNSLTANENCER